MVHGFNFTILAEEIAKRVATYQNGSPTTIIGPPTSRTHVSAEFWRDALGGQWACTVGGTLGTWIHIKPAAVTADPASGTIPTGYLVWNVTDGAVKRHAGAYAWEITVGASTSAKVGFHGATPTAQRAGASQAEATDLATVITLANELSSALVEKGLIKGGRRGAAAAVTASDGRATSRQTGPRIPRRSSGRGRHH